MILRAVEQRPGLKTVKIKRGDSRSSLCQIRDGQNNEKLR